MMSQTPYTMDEEHSLSLLIAVIRDSHPPNSVKSVCFSFQIDLGVHIDGYIATAANTVVVGASPTNKVTGKHAALLKATYEAMEVAIRMLQPGNKNMDITAAIDKLVLC
ncbi:hypothetical protein ANCCAN_15794 [Ancylostoma caninum]|uniref:Peptidase M24 domain-containing protein n=1 Tax=Ancylostoma caninum TaxID=29170 RepID=A0A368G3K5_ANCCA|nr:hypothetical protein ANCCAN_15794 [Ancylostoma caninum]